MRRPRSLVDARQKCAGCWQLLPVAELANNKCKDCQPDDGAVRRVGSSAKTRHGWLDEARKVSKRH